MAAAAAMIVHLEHEVARTARVMQVEGMFDVPKAQRQEWDINVPPEVVDIAAGNFNDRWNVGLVVGPSGSGKTSVVNALFQATPMPSWRAQAAILDGFPDGLGAKDITSLLTSVGLGSRRRGCGPTAPCPRASSSVPMWRAPSRTRARTCRS